MKKIIYLFIILGITAACVKSEDPIFEELPDQRLEKELAFYQELLTSKDNGWFLYINTKRGGGFKFWVSFDDNFRVDVLSDMDATYSNVGETSVEVQNSGYRIKALMAPSLIFDTYSYIHVLADPNPKIIDGDRAEGLESDFEFSLVNVEENGTVNLRGNFNGCQAMLVPVSAGELERVKAGALKTDHLAIFDYASTMQFTATAIDGITVAVEMDPRNVQFSYYDEEGEFDSVKSSAYVVAPTKEGDVGQINFFEPVEVLGKKYHSIDWSGDGYQLIAEDMTPVAIFDNKRPPYPLLLGYGKTFTTFETDVAELEGSMSDLFMEEVYNVADQRMIDERAGRSLHDIRINFELNTMTNEEEMRLRVRYANKAGSLYTTTWYYTYEIDSKNVITFTSRRQAGNNNDFNYERSLKEVPDFFCELEYENYESAGSWNDVVVSKTITKSFKIDWVENNTPDLEGNLGGFVSVDNSAMYLTGVLGN